MGKIMLNGVDYSAPVGGGSGESTEQIKEISERVKILEVKVPFGFSTTSVGAYGYLDLEGNFHEFGSGEQSEFIEGIKGEYSQTSKVLAFKDASTNVNMLYARGGVEINGSGTNVSIAAASGSIAAGQYSNTKYININNSTQIKVPASASEIEIPFSFGIDADGNCGFKKPGADSVTPFKKGVELDINMYQQKLHAISASRLQYYSDSYVYGNLCVLAHKNVTNPIVYYVQAENYNALVSTGNYATPSVDISRVTHGMMPDKYAHKIMACLGIVDVENYQIWVDKSLGKQGDKGMTFYQYIVAKPDTGGNPEPTSFRYTPFIYEGSGPDIYLYSMPAFWLTIPVLDRTDYYNPFD